jgi:hypothetical protein
MPRISKGLKQAYELQDFTFEAAMALKAELAGESGKMKIAREDAAAIASLVKSWEACQERIRIHRGKPMPGSYRPERKPTHHPLLRDLSSFLGEDPTPVQ